MQQPNDRDEAQALPPGCGAGSGVLGRITGLRAVSRPRWRPSRFPGGPLVHVAVTRESAQPGGDTPSSQPGWQAMAAKLGTPDGRALYKQRRAIIESVFAQLFARFGRTLRAPAAA